MVAVAQFCRLAEKIHLVCGPSKETVDQVLQAEAEAIYGEAFWSEFKGRFAPEEADQLGQRFALMTEKMQADRERSDAHYSEVDSKLFGSKDAKVSPPDFDWRALCTHYYQMPELTIEELIASW